MNGPRPAVYSRFRITESNGMVVSTEPIPPDEAPPWARDVSPEQRGWESTGRADEPLFAGPIPFVIPPRPGSRQPFYPVNHCPAISWCANGDLLAAWYSTEREYGTEMTILASRLRWRKDAWEPAGEFFNAVERNMTGTALFHDGRGKLYHFNGVGPEGVTSWDALALVVRESEDNGVSWTSARPISTGAVYASRHQVIAGTLATAAGVLIQPCDAVPGPQGGTALHISCDGGRTWADPGGEIRGIHAGVVEIGDGRLRAFGRDQSITGRMPTSVSNDMGRTWTYEASPFPPISGGQRLALLRLREGPLLLASFTDGVDCDSGMLFRDADGAEFRGRGLFAALSYDDGASWPLRKLLTPGIEACDGAGHSDADGTRAELAGYLAATQTPDRVLHLISSALYYRFNMAWLQQPPAHP